MGTNYPDLEPGNEFWNRVQVPSSWYKSLLYRICLRQRNKDFKIGVNIPKVEVTGVPIYGSKTYGWKMISTAQNENGPHECRERPMLSTAPVRLFRITNTIPRTLSSASKWPSECHRKTCVHCPMSMSILYKAEGKTAIC